MQWRALLVSSALLALLVASPRARASMVEALDLAGLVHEADEVVLARVMKSFSHYDQLGRIVTDYSMRVEQTEKGKSAPGAAIVVRRFGGIVGGRGMRIAGEPTFKVGELVLLFGVHGGDTYLRTVGMSQGALRVFEQGGERWTRSDTQGMALVRRRGEGDKTGSSLAPATSAIREPRKLADVLSEVRSYVDAPQR